MKVLQVSHGLEPQTALTGDGRGTYTMISGCLQIHKAVLELLKLDIVCAVECAEGYFVITVDTPHRWKEIDGVVVHIVARALTD
jgi:hypothetical protein